MEKVLLTIPIYTLYQVLRVAGREVRKPIQNLERPLAQNDPLNDYYRAGIRLLNRHLGIGNPPTRHSFYTDTWMRALPLIIDSRNGSGAPSVIRDTPLGEKIGVPPFSHPFPLSRGEVLDRHHQ